MFVYNSSLDLSVLHEDVDIENKSLQESLQIVFSGTDIRYEVKDGYVLLQKIKQYTLSGYVYQETGEAVVHATVLDMTTGNGTLTNERGFLVLFYVKAIIKSGCHVLGQERIFGP